MLSKLHWGGLFIFGTIYLQLMISSFFQPFPLYISLIISAILVFFFYTKINFRIESIEIKMHVLLWVLQILNILFYFSLHAMNFNVIPFLIFIVIELFRYHSASKIYFLAKAISQYEIERKQFNEMFMTVRVNGMIF